MGRMVTLIVVLAALAAPSALADKPTRPNGQNAAQQCKAQLLKMGAKDFNALWKNRGQCVALTAQQNQDDVTSAEEKCRADRAKDAVAFAVKWGSNKNAFGKCVSQTAQSMSQQQQQAILSAAQTCKAERAKDAAAFRTTYGHGKRNAFAQCVAQHKKK
jgi:hypothetical protein